MGKLIIDKVTGTVLNIDGCYVIDADQLDDSFTDSEIADLADRLGVKVTLDIDVNTLHEHQGIELFHQMCGKFGWTGCIFTDEDIRQQLEQEEVSEEDMDAMVEKVGWTRWWRKVMDEAMVETGYEILAEAIAEATTEKESQ